MILNLFSGPGGWCVGSSALGMERVAGIELDAAACATRAEAGHVTIRADVAAFSTARLAQSVAGLIASPPCTTFSSAGDQAGAVIMALLADLIRQVAAGHDWREPYAERMARELTESPFGSDVAAAKRAAKIARAVASACLVAEPARFLAACDPEWVALEQVPPVLPLWKVYAGELRRRGYSAWCGLLNSADYGVPQTRVRAILIASRVRRVSRPEPTHYDPRRGDQLWGTPWVSMAEALGWGATGRPAPTTTAGGTATGGAEPFGHRDRDALEAERDAGRWALRIDAQQNASVRDVTAPAPALKFGHSSAEMQWVLRRDRGAGMIEREGERRDHPLNEPAPCITAGVKGSGPRLSWVMDPNASGHMAGYTRPLSQPSPTLTGQGQFWKLRNNSNENACERSLDEPAGTIFFSQRANDVSWVAERPATTVQGDPRIGHPGHKDRDKGERQFEHESVRITVPEAAVLQSFPPDYPWQGTKTKQFEQVGNAMPPLLAFYVLAMATGISVSERAA